MKSFDQLAQAGYFEYCKRCNGKDLDGVTLATWDELPQLSRAAWVCAVKQIAAELSSIH